MKSLYKVAAMVLVPLTGLLTAGAMPAVASSPTTHTALVKQVSATPKYSDTDMVSLLLFGTGKAAQDRPDLLKTLGIKPNPNATPELISSALSQLKAVDKDFHQRVTVDAQAKDPYKAQAALAAFKSDVQAVVNQHTKASSASALAHPMLGENAFYTTNYFWVDNQVAQSVAGVTSFAVLAEAAAVFLFLYTHDDSFTAFDQASTAAAISQTL